MFFIMADAGVPAWTAAGGPGGRYNRQARSMISKTTVCVIAATLLHSAAAGLHAARKPLWSDEMSTLYVSQLPGFPSVWAALKDGVDQSLPLLFVATRASMRLFGSSP